MGRKRQQKQTPDQLAYAAMGRKIAAFQKEVDAGTVAFAKRLSEENPEYAGFNVMPQNRAYIRGKQGKSKAFIKIAEHMMWASNVTKTQGEILEDVQKQFPAIKLHRNMWNRPLLGKTKKSVETMVKGNMDKPIDLRECDTLAKIRKKVKVAREVKAGKHTFKTEITFNREAVVIGKTSHPLIMRPSGNKTYPCIRVDIKGKGRCWVRMDGLVAALKKS